MNKYNKIIIILIVIIIISIFVINGLNNFSKEKLGIENIIGEPVAVGEISISEYTLLTQRTLGAYFKYLREGRIEDAYTLLTPEYKQYVSSGDFEAEALKYDYNTFEFKTVAIRTENMYELDIELSDGLIHKFLLILNDKTFAIVPEPFLKYEEVNQTIKKDNVTYNLIGYEVDLEECYFYLEITNDNKEEIKISSAHMEATNGSLIYADDIDYIIPANSTESILIKFETSIDFPEILEIERDAGNKLRIYTFKL